MDVTQPLPKKRSPESCLAVGLAAARNGFTTREMYRAADVLGIEPFMRLNMIDYFSEADIERIRDHLRRQAATHQELN